MGIIFMHFLYPAFLLALLLLIIPIVIHLFNFRRYKKVLFSNVQFLKDVQEQQASRRNLKERLILASRLSAIIFLVFAFARPYVTGKDEATAGKLQAVSVFVDNSFSMQALSREGTLLNEAKQQARQIAAAFNINDRFQLLTQDFEGRHQRLLSRTEFNDAVDEVKISTQNRRLRDIINRQESLINMQPHASNQTYIISDFQRNMRGSDSIINTHLPVKLVQLAAGTFPNVAVDSVWMLNAIHRPGESEKIVVRLRNYADKIAEKVPLKVIINGFQKAIGSYTLTGRSSQTDTLTFSGLQGGWQRGEIQLQDNPITFDNQFYFSFYVNKQLPILLINGGTPNRYLNAIFLTDAFFAPKQVTFGNVDYASLGSYPIIILSDIKSLSAGLSQQLNTYVKKGGTLIIFPSADADESSYRAFLQPLGAAYLDKLITVNTKVSAINLHSSIFKSVFESVPQSPDLPSVKKYYSLNAGTRQAEYLMRLQSGESLWQGSAFGTGKIYLSAVALNEDFSNLPVHALFVPVMFRIALLSGHDQSLFYTAGVNKPIETVPLQPTEKQIVKMVKGSQTIIPEVKQTEGSTMLYLPTQMTEPGIYELKSQDSTVAFLAFNDNRSESDLSYLKSAELQKMLPQNTALLDGSKLNTNSITSLANSGLQLWKLCIILTLISLAVETLLIRVFKTDTTRVSQADIN
jgi:hypothetical protein